MNFFPAIMNQMLYLFLCILIGLVAAKCHLLPDNAKTVVSRLESFLIMPAMIVNNFANNCSFNNLLNNLDLLLWGLFFLVVQVALAYVALPLFRVGKDERGVYLYSLAIVNLGFMGNSLVGGIYGQEQLFRYLIFTIPSLMFIYSIGVLWLKPQKGAFSFKSLLNPLFGYMALGLLLGVFEVELPIFVSKTLSNLAACYSPLAMILTGLVIGAYDIKKLIGKPKVYVLTLYRCLILPILFFVLAAYFDLPKEIELLMAFLVSMPLGLNTIVLPASYGMDADLGASMAVISNIAGLFTVPLLLSLFL